MIDSVVTAVQTANRPWEPHLCRSRPRITSAIQRVFAQAGGAVSETFRDRVRTIAMTTRCSERCFAARDSRRGVDMWLCAVARRPSNSFTSSVTDGRCPHVPYYNDGYMRSTTTTDICAVLSSTCRWIWQIDAQSASCTWPLHKNEQTSEQSRRAHLLTQMAAQGENVSHSRGGEREMLDRCCQAERNEWNMRV
jgi:hypothetical protein